VRGSVPDVNACAVREGAWVAREQQQRWRRRGRKGWARMRVGMPVCRSRALGRLGARRTAPCPPPRDSPDASPRGPSGHALWPREQCRAPQGRALWPSSRAQAVRTRATQRRPLRACTAAGRCGSCLGRAAAPPNCTPAGRAAPQRPTRQSTEQAERTRRGGARTRAERRRCARAAGFRAQGT